MVRERFNAARNSLSNASISSLMIFRRIASFSEFDAILDDAFLQLIYKNFLFISTNSHVNISTTYFMGCAVGL